MQSLRRGVSFLKSGPSSAGAATPKTCTNPSGPAAALHGFLDGSGAPAEETDGRRLLLHQEAVAALGANYVNAVLRALSDLAAAHDMLFRGLQQGGDLIEKEWASHAGSLANQLQAHAERSGLSLAHALGQVAETRQEHRETVRLATVSERATRRRAHYECKVERLRAAVQDARDKLGNGKLEPGADAGTAAGTSTVAGNPLTRSMSHVKSMQADLKQGRLCRNEEKLAAVQKREVEAAADARESLEHSLTVGRQRLRVSLEVLLRTSVNELLPGVQQALDAATKAVPVPPPRDPAANARRYGALAPVAPASAHSPNALANFAIGEHVLVTGLSSSPQFNGAEGIVKSLRTDGRVEVEVSTSANNNPNMAGYAAGAPQAAQCKVLALKSENCRRRPQQEEQRTCAAATDEFICSGGGLLCLDDPSVWPLPGEKSDDSSDGTTA
eukprot:gnl/TRDRNA2_/TRDRNA2_194302_c0_seq1.p1 gnl/TRDRNA2_/TRDRNA2_194302_c0~~gnl/TRDRNA2_/TRDRNA2_194302_c0_seq1.p1  ORF type:complete len:443 (+),score=95.10 gnl/TRDRNA2_/TRDRNA2_194302_c0_seq1:67-1395(+)